MSTSQSPIWRQLPLSGTSLIEASAGTGKTWNIALLYLRLVLERKLGARQILVTTFTDAAAQELRARIRARLLDAEHIVDEGQIPDSDLGTFLSERCESDGGGVVLARLRLALTDIDTAPISTIHGFCRRVLSDYPFDTGMPFALGEIVDEHTLVRECVEDFWRSRYLVESLDPLEALMVVPDGPEHLAELVKNLLGVPEAGWANGNAEGVRQWWRTLCETQLTELKLLTDDVSVYARSNSALRTQLSKLLSCASDGNLSKVKWETLGAALQPDALRNYGHRSLATPLDQHPLLGPWSALADSIRLARQIIPADVAQRCARFVIAELERRLRLQGSTTFSQLIAEVHDRVTGPDGPVLAERLRKAWPVALIDEFQDTDARQWAIFDRIYQQAADPGDTALMLIGDPKQSIYAFRGADIHAYLAARQKLPEGRQYSIRDNFRSHPRLLAALNDLYGLAADVGFGGTEIRYVAVDSGAPEKFASIGREQPLRLRLLQCEATKLETRDSVALTACANDIVALLADSSSGVKPGDIAVLIDSNKRIQRLRELLIERRVPVVGAGRASVLATEWANDLQLLLFALLQPNDEYAVRGALATRLLGATARELTELAGDARAWERKLDQFANWRRMWDRRGVLAVIEAVVLEKAPRLLASADGERALTDLRHLGEVLQDAAADCYGPEELYAWFVGERDSANPDSVEAGREQQLRIESEAKRVQLLTIHSSKGLEYPVVFIPTAWRARNAHNRDVRNHLARYHDKEHRLCLDFGTADFDANKATEHFEGLQERLRVLYVAMTRAKEQCIAYVFDDIVPRTGIDGIDKHNSGALTALLSSALSAANSAAAASGAPWDALSKAVPAMRIDWTEAARQSYCTETTDPLERIARAPLPSERPYHGLYSFTALMRMGVAAAVDAPQWAEDEAIATDDGNAPAAAAEPPDPLIGVLARLKGPRFGDAVHQLLEQGRATDDVPAALRGRYALQTDRIAAALNQESVKPEAGREPEQLAAVADILDRTLDSPLAPGLRLADLAPTACRSEFEFAFVVDEAHWYRMHGILDAHGLGDWWPVSAERRVLRGMMKGFMDLVFAWDGRFHVLDYKTNWLGEGRLSDYAPESLDTAMQEHHYGLQALIYTVALHRYLAHRLIDYDPDVHLGDSWYLFVRAVGLGPNAGIWRKRFPQSLIDQLDALFEGQEVRA